METQSDCIKRANTPVDYFNYTAPTFWSDSSEYIKHCSKHPCKSQCVYYMYKLLNIFEILTLFITCSSPFLMISIPYIWIYYMTKSLSIIRPNTDEHSKHFDLFSSSKTLLYSNFDSTIMSEIKLIELSVKLFLFCVSQRLIYQYRFKPYGLYSKYNWTPYSALNSTINTKNESSKQQRNHYLLEISQRNNMVFYLILDFIACFITHLFWVRLGLTWSNQNWCPAQSSRLNEFPNPFKQFDRKIQPNACHELNFAEIDHFKSAAFDTASMFVCVHLAIQMSVIFLAKLKQLTLEHIEFVVQVQRANDGLIGHYRVGAVDLHVLVQHLIEQIVCDFGPCDPFILRRKCPSKPDVLSDSEPSRRRSTDIPGRQCSSMKSFGSWQSGRRWSDEKSNVSDAPRPSVEFVQYTPPHESVAASAFKQLHSDLNYAKFRRKREAKLTVIVERLFEAAETKDWATSSPSSKQTELVDQKTNFIYPQLINPLRKYLRFTKQLVNYSHQSLKSHLKTCLLFNVSAKAYLSHYLHPPVSLFTKSPCHSNPNASLVYQTWKLKYCHHNWSSAIYHGLTFELVRSNTTYLCHIKRIPQIQLEEIPKDGL